MTTGNLTEQFSDITQGDRGFNKMFAFYVTTNDEVVPDIYLLNIESF